MRSTSVTKKTKLVRTKTPDFSDFWDNEREFVFNTMGSMIGFGNLLAFPHLCYSNGGGAFLIPYFISLFCIGIPMIVFEFSIGQLSCGVMNNWMFCPLLSGVEHVTSCIALLISGHYVMYLTWVLLYIGFAFKKEIPWKHCRKEWSTFHCSENLFEVPVENCTLPVRAFDNGTCYDLVTKKFKGIHNKTLAKAHGIREVLPAEEFLKYSALKFGKSSGFHDLGQIDFPIAACLCVVWLLVVVTQIRGFRFYRKIAYYTTSFTFLGLTLLGIKMLTLTGSGTAMTNYLRPDTSYLNKGDTWTKAISHVFFSTNLASNSLSLLARRNRFRYNVIRNAFITGLVDTLISFLSGFVIFGFLGSFAYRFQVGVHEVLESSTRITLLFVILPQELVTQTMGRTACLVFFIMLFLIGFSSQLIYFETAVTWLADSLHLRQQNRHLLSCFICLILLIIGLNMTRPGGIYVFTIFNDYSSAWNAIIAELLMIIAIYLHGANQFCNEIETMVGSKPLFKIPWKFMKWYFISTWCVIAPICLLIFLISIISNYKPSQSGKYVFPAWANAIGLLMESMSVACFFLGFIQRLLCQEGSLTLRLKALLRPDPNWAIPPPDHQLRDELPEFQQMLLSGCTSVQATTDTTKMTRVHDSENPLLPQDDNQREVSAVPKSKHIRGALAKGKSVKRVSTDRSATSGTTAMRTSTVTSTITSKSGTATTDGEHSKKSKKKRKKAKKYKRTDKSDGSVEFQRTPSTSNEPPVTQTDPKT